MDNKRKLFLLLANYIKVRWATTMLLSLVITLAGCQTSSRTTSSVGSFIDTHNQQKKPRFNVNSKIYLDVAVPVFNPGIPKDQDKITEQGIWPQLRRAEANRFALNTKEALQKTAVFGNVSVIPNSKVAADLYVLGRIKKSDSQNIQIYLEVVDISGKRWGKKTFKHKVSEGFYRDKRNVGKDPYQPIFDDIARYVYKLLKHKSEHDKTRLKQITDMRFASSFSPESYKKYLYTNRRGWISLTGLPDGNDPMSKRIALLRLQDQLFIDRLQIQYEAFSVKTEDSYHTWQKKTLPIVIAAEKAESKALFVKILGGLAIVAGAMTSQNNSSTNTDILTNVAIIGGGLLIKNGFGYSAEAKVQRATIDEMGEYLDIEMDPQVMTLEEKTVKLTGTANDQYIQWRSQLKKIFILESTADSNLQVEAVESQ